MIRLLKRACVLVFVALLAVQGFVPPAPVQAATTYYISYSDDEFSPVLNNCSLREAIYSANRDMAYGGCPKGNGADVIILKADDYELKVTGGSDEYGSGDLDIYTNMTITGAGARVTKIMGVGLNDRIFHIQKHPSTGAAPTVTLSNLKISGGVTNSYFGGGGVLLQQGSLTLSWVEVASNSAPTGGGVSVYREATLFKADSVVFRSNQATTTGIGGAIYNESTMIIDHSLLESNSATSSGGAIDNRPLTKDKYGLVQNTTIANNTSTGGAGIATSGPGQLRLYNSTVARNTGNGLLANSDSVLYMRQTILALNNAPNCRVSDDYTDGSIFSQGFNLIKDNPDSPLNKQCIFVDTENGDTDLIGTSNDFDPMLSDNLYPSLLSKPFMQWFQFVSPSSPAIDMIPPEFVECPASDQLFHGRPANSLCDIGAIEYGAEGGQKKLFVTFLRR